MNNLFGNTYTVQPQESTLETCRTCIHRQRWECGSKVISYCRVRRVRETMRRNIRHRGLGAPGIRTYRRFGVGLDVH